MSDSARLRAIKQNFEILKDSYDRETNNDVLDTIAEKIIVPALSIDVAEASEMWEYLLRRYYGKTHYIDYNSITEGIVNCADFEPLVEIFTSNDVICDYVFRLNPYDNHLYYDYFIRDLMIKKKYELSNKLIGLYFQNDNGDNDIQTNLFSFLQTVINSSESRWGFDSFDIEYISQLIPAVTDELKRAELEVSMMELVECVENGADKGMKPLYDLSAEGIEAYLNDMIFGESDDDDDDDGGEAEAEEKSAYEQYMSQRGNKNEAEAGEVQAEKQFDAEELENCRKSLDELIGLDEVKQEVSSLSNLMRISIQRRQHGLSTPETSQHLVFSGNPGTGKTTVARLVGKIYHAIGYLSKGHLVEVDRSGLVAGYVGQTAIKTQEVLKSALGGVLFIDEAYSLSVSSTENDYGHEAIETILKFMEDNRDDLVVIVAGYDNLMAGFINSNPGLKSRFSKYIHFPDYTGDELFEIFLSMLNKNDYIIDDRSYGIIKDYFIKIYENRGENFGNAREVRNFFEKAVSAQADRLILLPSPTKQELTEITEQDVLSALED